MFQPVNLCKGILPKPCRSCKSTRRGQYVEAFMNIIITNTGGVPIYEQIAAGFIQSFTGRGSFVSAADPEMLKEQNLREIEEYLSKAAEIAKRSGVTKEELTEILTMLYSDNG